MGQDFSIEDLSFHNLRQGFRHETLDMILGEISQRLKRGTSVGSPQICFYRRHRTRCGAPTINGRSYDEDELKRFEVENDGFPLAATDEEIREFDKSFLTGKPRRQKRKQRSRSLTEVVTQASLRLPALSRPKFVDKLITGAANLARKSPVKLKGSQEQLALNQPSSDSPANTASTVSAAEKDRVSENSLEIEFLIEDVKFCSQCGSQLLFENVKSCSTDSDDSEAICFACQIQKCDLILSEHCDFSEDFEDSGTASVNEASAWLPEDIALNPVLSSASSDTGERVEDCDHFIGGSDSEPELKVVDPKPDNSEPSSLIAPGHVKRQCEALAKSLQSYKKPTSSEEKLRKSESEQSVNTDVLRHIQDRSHSPEVDQSNKWTKNCFNLAKDSTFSQTAMAKGYVRALAEHIDHQGTLKQTSDDEDESLDTRNESSRPFKVFLNCKEGGLGNLTFPSQQISEQHDIQDEGCTSQKGNTTLSARRDDLKHTSHSDTTVLLNSNLTSKFLSMVQDDLSLNPTNEKSSLCESSKKNKNLKLSIDSHQALPNSANYKTAAQDNDIQIYTPSRNSHNSSFTLPHGMKLMTPSEKSPPNSSPKRSPTKCSVIPRSPVRVQEKPVVNYASKPKTKPSSMTKIVSKTLPRSCSSTHVSSSQPSSPHSSTGPPPLPLNPPQYTKKSKVSSSTASPVTPQLESTPTRSPKSPTLLLSSPARSAPVPSPSPHITSSSPATQALNPLSSKLPTGPLTPSAKPPLSPKPSPLLTKHSPAFPLTPAPTPMPPKSPPVTPVKTPAIPWTMSPSRSPTTPSQKAPATFQTSSCFSYEDHLIVSSNSQSGATLRGLSSAQNSPSAALSDEVSTQPVSPRNSDHYRNSVLSSIFDNSVPLNAAELFDSSWSDSDSLNDCSDEDDNDEDDNKYIRTTLSSDPKVEDHSEEKISDGCDLQHGDKRFRIVEELLLTERDYVERLHLLHEIFYYRLNKENHHQSFLPADVLQHMFSNTKSIFLFHNDFLLPQLEERMKHWEQDPRIGDLMKKNAPFLKMYTEYIRNFDNAMKLINQWMEKSSRFSEIIQDIQKLPECRNLSLQHHMLGPIQRVPRYELLLKDYVKHLPEDSPDMSDAKDALDLVTRAACHSNEAMKKIETFHKLLDIYQSLRGVPIDFISPTREFVMQGPVTKISARSGEKQPRQIFLFNDLVLVCTQYNLLGTYSVRSQLEVDGMEIKPGTNMNIPNTFLVHGKQKAVELLDENPAGDSCSWYEKIRNVIDNYKKKKQSIRQEEPKDFALETSTSKICVGKIAPVWIQDDAATMCMLCRHHFNMVRRRHHCRACGRLICKNCCKKAPLEYLKGKIERVCTDCYNIIVNKQSMTSSESSGGIKSPKKKDILHVKANAGLISGYMHCSNDGGHSWQRLWVTAHKNFVLYTFRAHEDVSAISSLPLPGHEVGQVWDLEGRKHVFCLSHKKTRIHMFQTDNDKRLRRWISILSKLVQAELPDENSRLSSQSNSSNSSSLSDSGTVNNGISSGSNKRGSTYSGSQADSGYPGDSSNSLAALTADDNYQDGISQDDNADGGISE